MKKLIFTICAVALTFGVNAEENTETVRVSQTNNGRFYAGLGLSVSKTGIKTEATSVSVNGVACPNAEGVITNDYDTMFFGTLVLGYDKPLTERTRLAFEGMLDIGPDPDFNHAGAQVADDCLATITSKQNGLVPSIGLKLTYIPSSVKSTLYLKVGAALSMVKMNYVGNSEYKIAGSEYKFPSIYASTRCTKLAPLISVGMERQFDQSDFTTRFEMEYRFGISKKCNYQVQSETAGGKAAGISNGTVKVSSKDSITLRIMAVYAL